MKPRCDFAGTSFALKEESGKKKSKRAITEEEGRNEKGRKEETKKGRGKERIDRKNEN